MNLTKKEYGELIDSRLVELERCLKEYKDNEPMHTDEINVLRIQDIIMCAERLAEVHEARQEAKEQEQIAEAEAEYQKEFKKN